MRIALGLAVSVVFIYLAVRGVQWPEVAKAFRGVELLPWVPLGLLAYLSSLMLRGLRCRAIAAGAGPIRIATAANVVVLGSGVNNLFPARLGEFVRAGMLARFTGSTYARAFTIVVLERVLDGLAIVAAFSVAAWLLPVPAWMSRAAALAGTGFLALLAGFALAAAFPSFAPVFAATHLRWLPRAAREWLLRLAFDVTQALHPLRAPGLALRVVALSAAIWTIDAAAYLALFPAFGFEVSLAAALLVMSVTNLGVLLPSSPGHVGPFHFFCMSALVALGASQAPALSYAVAVHLLLYVPTTLWALGIIAAWGVRLSRPAAEQPAASDALQAQRFRVRSFGQFSQPAPGAAAPPFLRAMVETMLPAASAQLLEEERRAVIDSVAGFVHGQLNALAVPLRVQVRVGLLGFRLSAWLRYGRAVCGLAPDERKRLIDAWSYGPLHLPRQLLRAVRSIALLAYFEHPAVVRAGGGAR